MNRSPLAAGNHRIAWLLAAAILLSFPGTGAAQDGDPFALPKGTTMADAESAETEGPGLSAIVVDGRLLPRMVELAWLPEGLAIDVESAAMAGLPVPEGATGLIALDQLDLARWSFDRLSQELSVRLLRRGDGPNDIDVARRNFRGGNHSPLLAAIVDYDLSATLSSGRMQTAAVVAPRIAFGHFRGGSTFRYLSEPGDGEASLARLDTTMSLALPRIGVAASLGDLVTAGALGQRPLRIGGLQIGTDFGLRPDLVTTPMPEFAGQVAVPTTLDLLVNDQRIRSAELEAGDFQVRNIPVSPGRGEVSVVVRDPNGREVVQNTRIYVSREMLARGLWEGGANVGLLRRGFGDAGSDYRDLVGTFFLRHGLSNEVTVGLSGEAGLGVRNFGAEAAFTIVDAAMIFGEARFSRGAGTSGKLFRVGAESVGESFSARVEAIWPDRGYRDIAARAGDPLPARQINATLGFDLRDTIRLQLSASRQRSMRDPAYPVAERKIDFVRAGLRLPLGSRADLNADISYRRGTSAGVAALVGLSLRFGERHSLQFNAVRRGGSSSFQAGVYRPDLEPGDIGYGLRAERGDLTSASASLAWRNRYNRLSLDAEYVGGRAAARAGASGTLVFAGDTVFARNQTGGSYALVRTGRVGGVTVTRENRPAGITDSQGRLLVENVSSLIPIQFDIDPDRLPEDAVAKATYRRIIVGRGAVARVDLDVEAFRSQALRLVDRRGVAFAQGMDVVAQPSGRTYTIGFDGLIDLDALAGDESILIPAQEGADCRASLPRITEESFDVPEIVADCSPIRMVRRD